MLAKRRPPKIRARAVAAVRCWSVAVQAQPRAVGVAGQGGSVKALFHPESALAALARATAWVTSGEHTRVLSG
jgi:hypothetical protein